MVLSFNIAQTFTVDPNLGGGIAASISGIDIYWKYKPPSQQNISTQSNPGVTVYLVPTIYGVPDLTTVSTDLPARAEWSSILTSSDASVPSRFEFPTPIPVTPGKMYAVVCCFDNNETFVPWLSVSGDLLVGTTTKFTGTPPQGVGAYYESIGLDGTVDPTKDTTQAEFLAQWKPLVGTFLAFNVYAARYALNGQPIDLANLTPLELTNYHKSNIPQYTISGSNVTYFYPSQAVENVSFDLNTSTVQAFVGAQRVYQNTVFYPGGYANGASYITVSSNSSTMIIANTLYSNGTSFNWANVYNNYTGVKFITLFDTSTTNIRKISSIINATAIIVDEPTTFSNSLSKFMITPVATVDSLNSVSPFGKRQSMLFLNHSSANSTVRFVNNCITSVTSTGGSGYSNTDVLYLTGYESISGKVSGGYIAVGNIVTNATGGITNIYLSNQGAGFINTSTIHVVVGNSSFNPVGITNSTANTTASTNAASFTFGIGAYLLTELTNNIFANCKFINLDVHDVTPYFNLTAPSGTTYSLQLQLLYYGVADPATTYGYSYYVNPNANTVTYPLTINKKNFIVSNIIPTFVSYSNEFNIKYANGSPNDKVNSLVSFSNNYVLTVTTQSNNDFYVITVDNVPTVELAKFVINNDYTLENTNYGNAYAKHLTTMVNFGALAEDIRVYATLYKPVGTDIQCYARIQNSGDPEPFDDEDWTRLRLVAGNNVFSSPSNQLNYVDVTYGFQQYPNTAFTAAGSATTSNNIANVVGVGTTWQTNATANITANNLVRIYNPLFANTNYVVAKVVSVANDTFMTLDTILTSNTSLGGNPSLIGAGLAVDVITYDFQGFNNINYDNTVRYYNTSYVKFDGYDNIQFKFCFLSNNVQYIPRINTISAIGLSA